MTAEKINIRFENERSHGEQSSQFSEKLKSDRENAAREAANKHSGEQHKVRAEVEKALETSEKYREKQEKQPESRGQFNTGVKKQQYKATMRRVEARLPVYQKAFSKFINNPVIDKTANVLSRSVARPSGLMGGAIASFFGLLFIYLNARRVGFEFSPGSALIFFITVGWLSGLLIEYILGAIKKIVRK